ncbi:MAG TPA: DUF1489 domain-containing protein [Sphingobium sp.]|jgi:hypothetical protein|uniref:DUF1489 family protein n=1 Tax=unclassified Sphingobium TaxID=2611147 RepID=UPI0007F448DB|nr:MULTISPECIES: DUF1489 domain-containing protein [unclassified Sphingobium]OAN55905.1 hypothetical protein A7Q26_20305 [Sphingobium sp. TCM1]HAF42679.1 DUF1489 domain-containing protein [Sphingobium sp.]
MPLHLTKIAFQSESPASLRAWLESHAGEARLTTRYLPKRLEELDGGSLYWIHGHALVGRSPLLGFQETGQGRYWIRLAPTLIPVRASPKRAHQGWRYLEDKDAPPDLNGGEADDLDAMPSRMLGELTRLGLV